MSPSSRYQLRVNVRIEQLMNDGRGQWYPAGGGGLEISDSVTLTASSFLELAGVLGQFHELAEKMRAAQEASSDVR